MKDEMKLTCPDCLATLEIEIDLEDMEFEITSVKSKV